MLRDNFRQKGEIEFPFLIVMVLVAIGLTSLVVDSACVTMVKAQLQNATDAGALAGAQDLWINIANAKPDAISWTGKNLANGNYVSTATPGVVVSANVTAPTTTTTGQVQVTASMPVKHVIASVFGLAPETITATSTAGTSGKLWLLNQNESFPVAVSLDAVPQAKGVNGPAFNTYKLGDTATIYLQAQGVKNAAFTSLTVKTTTGQYIQSAVDQALGFAPKVAGFMPSVKIGDSINFNNGMVGERQLANQKYSAALKGLPYIVVPLVTGTSPFNKSAPIVGFAAMKVTDVVTNQSSGNVEQITGILVNAQVLGESGPIPLTGNPINDEAISRIELGPIQLIR